MLGKLRAPMGCGKAFFIPMMSDYDFLASLAHSPALYSILACSAGVLIIRIPCIFNVLKANQLFPFHFPPVHSLSRSSFFLESHRIASHSLRTRDEWKNSFQVRVVFLYWLPCLLRMSRPGQESYECAPIPTGGSSEKTKQMNDVELRERYVNITGAPTSSTFIFSLKI